MELMQLVDPLEELIFSSVLYWLWWTSWPTLSRPDSDELSKITNITTVCVCVCVCSSVCVNEERFSCETSAELIVHAQRVTHPCATRATFSTAGSFPRDREPSEELIGFLCKGTGAWINLRGYYWAPPKKVHVLDGCISKKVQELLGGVACSTELFWLVEHSQSFFTTATHF